MPGIIHTTFFKTAFGELILGSFEDKLCLCDWRYRKMRGTVDSRIKSRLNAEYKEGELEIIAESRRQLEEYFEGVRKTFDLPLLLVGSDFQKGVWKELLRIPYGRTETYAGLSQKLGDIKTVRAVASANGANAIAIIVPCHRVLGSDGSMTGYAGGLQAKKKLLRLENAFAQGELFCE